MHMNIVFGPHKLSVHAAIDHRVRAMYSYHYIISVNSCENKKSTAQNTKKLINTIYTLSIQ